MSLFDILMARRDYFHGQYRIMATDDVNWKDEEWEEHMTFEARPLIYFINGYAFIHESIVSERLDMNDYIVLQRMDSVDLDGFDFNYPLRSHISISYGEPTANTIDIRIRYQDSEDFLSEAPGLADADPDMELYDVILDREEEIREYEYVGEDIPMDELFPQPSEAEINQIDRILGSQLPVDVLVDHIMGMLGGLTPDEELRVKLVADQRERMRTVINTLKRRREGGTERPSRRRRLSLRF